MMRILFVDDDRHVLNGLRRQLHGLRREWEMEFAPGGAEALDAIGSCRFDAVVTDMKMPVVDGAQVLAHAMGLQPLCARLVLSGYADPDRYRLASSCAHRYLDKPCPPDLLELEVRHALAMQRAVQGFPDDRLLRLWCEPPALEATFGELLMSLDAGSAVLPAHLEQLLLSHEELWEAVRDVLGHCLERAGAMEPAASPATAVRAVGAKPLLHALLVVRFLRRFDQGGGRLGEDSLRLGRACLDVARDRGLDEQSAMDAFVAGLLYPRVARDADNGWLDALAYMLPSTGFSRPCIAALGLGDRPQAAISGAEGPVCQVLAAARVALQDPASEALQGWLGTHQGTGRDD